MVKRFSLVGLLVAAIHFLIALPARALTFAVDLFDSVILAADPRAIADLFRLDDTPAYALDGPGRYVDPALLTDQKHEAGLARLGTVRHL